MSGFWNYTTCIRCDNLELIEQALTRIMEQEGCRRIPLPPLSMDVEELRRYPWHLCNELWIVGLFIGASGWTIVKSLPEEFLCRRAKGANHPRLSNLALQIGSDAFYVGVYEYGGILMEVDARGGIYISGAIGLEYSEEGKFFDEQINSQESQRFFLLNVPEEMQTAEQVLQQKENQRLEQWQEQFLEDYAQRNFPQMTPSELEQWKSRWKSWFKKDKYQLYEEKGGKKLYEALLSEASLSFGGHTDFELFERSLAQLLGGSRSYWYLGRDPLIYRAYTQQQQLAADGARLLYFQPAEHNQ